ncbi:MAG TPA: hypothetical protein VFA13_10645 [Candidatus Acidoferrum sp.]|jgi:hypothetical protein|nr:hypothetical protein [Candidatus Acidoferrum sp.]
MLLKKTVPAVVVVLMVGSSAFGRKKVNPEDFTLEATVIDVTSSQQARQVFTHANVPYFCGNPQNSFERGYCATAKNQSTSEIERSTVYTLKAVISDKIYDLQGPRLELGTYQARFTAPKRRRPAGIAILSRDRKGRPDTIWFLIAGEHQKQQPAGSHN